MASPRYAEPTKSAAAKAKARIASNDTDGQTRVQTRVQTRAQARAQTSVEAAAASASRPDQAEKRQPAIIESKVITEPGSSGDDLAQYYQQDSDSKKTKPVSGIQRARQILRFLDETPKDTLSSTWKWLETEEDKSQILTRTERMAKAEAECEDEEKWPNFLSTKSDGQLCGYLKTNLPKWVTSFEAQAQAQAQVQAQVQVPAPQADPVPFKSKSEGEGRHKTRVEQVAAGPLGDKLNEVLAKSFKSGRAAVNSDDKSPSHVRQRGTEEATVSSGEEFKLWSRLEQSWKSPFIYFPYSSNGACLTPSSPTHPQKHFAILPELSDGTEQHRFAVIEWEWARRWVNLHNQGNLKRANTNSNTANVDNNDYVEWWLNDRKEDDLNPIPDWIRKQEIARARSLGFPEPVYPKKVRDGMDGVPGGFGVWVKKDGSWVRLCKDGTAYRRVKGGVFPK
ncbi:hypothetical protein VMCG_10795 [Cytospora schulzeri]|uniref:Uncharacterized protein n=1 Tax=Cytospora schulzeri TaxID=448051 RepID=A0A423VA67_9PEZI|nr:hypothetical protein VMCG_10795 [Valsa malicola]